MKIFWQFKLESIFGTCTISWKSKSTYICKYSDLLPLWTFQKNDATIKKMHNFAAENSN